MDQQANQKSFGISQILHASWSLIPGTKLPIWAVLIPAFVISIILMLVMLHAFAVNIEQPSYVVEYLIFPYVSNAIIAPFYAGAFMISIRRSRGETIGAADGFQYFDKFIPAAIVLVLTALICNIPNIIVNIPGFLDPLSGGHVILSLLSSLFIVVAYAFLFMALPLAVDKNIAPIAALTKSFNLAKGHWLKILAVLLVVYLIMLGSMIPLAIGVMLQNKIVSLLGVVIALIAIVWLMPYMFITQAEMYHKLVD